MNNKNFQKTKKTFSRLLLIFTFSLILIIGLSENSAIYAQTNQITLSGVVVDSNGEPLPGASVIVQGETPTGVMSDMYGKFNITVNKGSVLSFSYIGFNTKNITITHQQKLKVVLETDAVSLNETVVVGYGIQKKESMVGAIVQEKGESLKSKGVVSNITDALSGSMPGVQVFTSTGMPGGLAGQYAETPEFNQASSILIRGKATWNNASPLILVDGMERNMNDVDINEIATFSVLKDASATAVYGVRGANGVILITTKKGKIGKARISFEVNYSMKQISKVDQVVGSYDALLARNYAVMNSLPISDNNWSTLYYPNSLLQKYKTGDPTKYTDQNAQDIMLKNFAPSTKANVTVQGGTKKVKYFTSAGYTYDGDLLNAVHNTKGYTGDFHYERFNFRSNLDFKITNTTNFSVKLSGYIGKQQIVPYIMNNAWYSIYKHAPDSPMFVYPDGTFGANNLYGALSVGNNGLLDISTTGTRQYNRMSSTTDFSLDQKLDFITKGLSMNGRFSYDNYFTTTGPNYYDNNSAYDTRYYDIFQEEWVDVQGLRVNENGFPYNDRAVASEETSYGTGGQVQRNTYYTISLNYKRTFAKHHNVSALALFSRQDYVMGSNFASKREDWVGRVTYDYKEKYLSEINAAYNGSQKFSNEYKFDLFPSLAVGWRASEENFMKNVNFVSNLKFKYSIGLVGNDNLNISSTWPYITSYVLGDYVLGMDHPRFGGPFTDYSYVYNSYVEGTPGNKDIHWEKSRKQNFGMELGLFDDMIKVDLDIYNEYRYDMLLAGDQRGIPVYFGAEAPAANLGKVRSHGYELEINFNKSLNKDWRIWGSYSWTLAKNKIIYKEDAQLNPDYKKQEGYAIGQNRSQKSSGIYNSWNDIFLYPNSDQYNGRSQTVPGDYKIVDYNSDGVITTLDEIPQGYTIYPQNTYSVALGASYKGFSVNLQFYGVYNVNQNYSAMSEFEENAAVVYSRQLNSTFTPEYGNSNASYRALATESNRNLGTADSFMLDGSFLRLKTMQISYTIPSKIVNKINLESAKIFINGNNLFYWSDLPADVEGFDYSMRTYPTTKMINLGMNVVF